jgi:hypothetical protein
VSAHPPQLRRDSRERLAAWLVTGPLGHLYSVVADLALFGVALLRRRLAGRS